jgi:hypothetical protein
MWIEAILTTADIQRVLEQFSPLTIRLGENGRLLLAEPTEVSLIADEGIGVVCDVTVHWPVLGFDVPVALKGFTLRVLPLVATATPDSPLVFRLQIDHTGVAVLPALFDHGITAKINAELEKKHVELSWKFMKTLTHEFRLPDAMASAASISVIATAGKAKATDKALGLAVQFETTVRRRLAPAESAAPAIPAVEGVEGADPHGVDSTSNGASAPLSPPVHTAEAFDVRSFVVGGAVAAMAFTTLGGLARLFAGNRHRSW